MKRSLVAVAILAGLFALTHAQRRPANRGPEPTRVDFGALGDYLNEHDKRRAGSRVVLDGVPLPASSEKHEQTGMFILQAGGDEDGVQLFTSAALAKRLRARLRPYTHRLTVC